MFFNTTTNVTYVTDTPPQTAQTGARKHKVPRFRTEFRYRGTSAALGMTVGFRYAKRTLLLCVHDAKQLPPSTLHRYDQQPPQPRLPAQNQRVPRIHLRLRRRPLGLLGKLRRCPQSHSPRKTTEKLEQRKKLWLIARVNPKFRDLSADWYGKEVVKAQGA